MRYTGLGSMPGTDFREACRVVLDLSDDLIGFPEVPLRDAASGMVGRTAGLLELPMTLDGDGWRLAAATGIQQARSTRWWRNDCDDFEELSQDHAGIVKMAVVGPWTMAASVRASHPTMNHVLADPGACRELGQALAEAAGELVGQLSQRLGREVWLQIDEPMIGGVLRGEISGFSGLHHYRVPDDDEVLDAWRGMVDAGHAAGAGQVWLHSCACGTPFVLARKAGFDALSADARHADAADWDLVGEHLDAGGTLALGVTRTDHVILPSVDQIVSSGYEWLRPLELDPELLGAQVVLTPACGLGTWPHAEAVGLLKRLAQASPLLAERLRG